MEVHTSWTYRVYAIQTPPLWTDIPLNLSKTLSQTTNRDPLRDPDPYGPRAHAHGLLLLDHVPFRGLLLFLLRVPDRDHVHVHVLSYLHGHDLYHRVLGLSPLEEQLAGVLGQQLPRYCAKC